MNIPGTISGARDTGMRDTDGVRLREIFVLIAQADAEHLRMGQELLIATAEAELTEEWRGTP